MCIYVEVWTCAKNCDQSLKVDHAALKTMQEPPVLFKMATVSLYLPPAVGKHAARFPRHAKFICVRQQTITLAAFRLRASRPENKDGKIRRLMEKHANLQTLDRKHLSLYAFASFNFTIKPLTCP